LKNQISSLELKKKKEYDFKKKKKDQSSILLDNLIINSVE